MTFFFDRCVAITVVKIVRALEEGKNDVVFHDDEFEANTSDVFWIGAVAQWDPKPIVISGDCRILTRRDEAAALAQSNLMFFCLAPGWTNLPFREYPWKFLKAWNNIQDEIATCRDPSIFKVAHGAGLKVEKLSPTRKHRQA
jgi:PIN like domain